LVEELGYDVILASDFPALPAPLPTLALAAGVTHEIRLGSYVLNAALRPPELIVHELATLDRLCEGRLDIGIGLGLGEPSSSVVVRDAMDVRGDVALATLPSARGRIAALEQLLSRLKDAFAGNAPHARFIQEHPPIVMGGAAPRLRAVAAREADRFTLSGPRDKGVYPALTNLESTRASFAEFYDEAGARANTIDLGLNLQFVVVTDDRATAAAEIQQLHSYLTVDEILESPRVAVGTHEEIANHLLCIREQMGVSFFVVLGPNVEDFAPVIARLR
jgi:probable F420-dependent oxidoreductase